MKLKIYESNKGYIILLIDKGRVMRYFLRDEQHTMEHYIPDIISRPEVYSLGRPFGNQVHPIYLSEKYQPKSLEFNHKKWVIWDYYRSLVLKNDKPKFIKIYAKQMKSKIDELGINGTYLYVMEQRRLEQIDSMLENVSV